MIGRRSTSGRIISKDRLPEPIRIDARFPRRHTGFAQYLADLGLLLSLVLASCAPAERSAAAETSEQPTVIQAADMQWTDLDPEGAPGVQLAALWGNPSEGPFGALLKLPAGFVSPLHTHTHDIGAVIVSGTYIQEPRGGVEFQIGPGSYMMQPGRDYQHTTRCHTASDCVLVIESSGAFDLFVVEEAGGGQ